MKPILVTGSSGLLGSALLKTLPGIEEFEGDITNAKAVDACGKNASWIIHTAAMTNVDACEKNQQQCWQVNVEGTKNVRNLARKLGAKLLYISTVSVFDGVSGNYQEADVPYPKNAYNLSKLLGEQAVLDYEN